MKQIMSVKSLRLKIEFTLIGLGKIKDLIHDSGKFEEEIMRVRQMIVVLLAFLALDDEGAQAESVYIERTINTINKYIDFMKLSLE